MGEWFGHGFHYADMEREFRPGSDFMRGWEDIDPHVTVIKSGRVGVRKSVGQCRVRVLWGPLYLLFD